MSNIQKAYDQWSSTYNTDENLTRDLDEVVTKKIFAGLKWNTILELGCGTGKNTKLFAQLAQTVYAIDFSQGMLAKARAYTQGHHVIFKVADLNKKWPIADQAIDLVVCNLVLEHIENLSFIFSEAFRVLVENGRFFLSELHPFKQYQGIQANFQQEDTTTEVEAFVHHISDFIVAANENDLSLLTLEEWWHEKDQNKPPRLVTFMFEKNSNSP